MQVGHPVGPAVITATVYPSVKSPPNPPVPELKSQPKVRVGMFMSKCESTCDAAGAWPPLAHQKPGCRHGHADWPSGEGTCKPKWLAVPGKNLQTKLSGPLDERANLLFPVMGFIVVGSTVDIWLALGQQAIE